jgi:hypothetical protein
VTLAVAPLLLCILTPFSSQYFYLCQITYKTSINLTKCSILLLYIRIFSNVRWFKYACYFLTGAVALYGTASVTATIFQCTPVSRAYNKGIPGVCIDNQKFWWANAGFSVATDLLILLIPMPLIYQLQIQRIQKMALVLVFGLGGFVVITSCLRMTTINIASTSPDSTYDIASTMWTVIEMNVALVCACLPMVRPLIVKIFPRLMPKSSSNKYGNTASKSGFSNRGYIMSHSQDRAEPSGWTHEGKDGITMTTIRKGDQSSEEYILHDTADPSESGVVLDQARQATVGPLSKNAFGIQKTVQYSVEYTKDKPKSDDWS